MTLPPDKQRELGELFMVELQRLWAVEAAARDLVEAIDRGGAFSGLLVPKLRSALGAVSSSSPAPGGEPPTGG